MSEIELLRSVGLRNTPARRQLLRLLGTRRAWSAAQLHAAAKPSDLSTVYRNLRDLEQAQVIESVLHHDGERYYELTGRQHHAHRVCDQCGQASCVPCPLKLKTPHRLELAERCADCKSKPS